MKLLIFIFSVLLSYQLSAQSIGFVRVYNLKGEKIDKGEVIAITDTSLQLKKGLGTHSIPATDVGLIKTKHSPANNILIGSAVGTTIGVIIGVASSNQGGFIDYSAGEGASAAALIGLPLGAAVGGITVLFKNSKTYTINGDATKWKAFQSRMMGN